MNSIFFILFIVLIFIAALPVWSHSRNFGYYPSGIAGIFLAGCIVLLFQGII